MTKQNTAFVLKLIVNILVLRLIFCDSSNCPARAGGLRARGSLSREYWDEVSRAGTVAVTVSSHIPGQIHRTFTGMRTGQGHSRGTVVEDEQRCMAGHRHTYSTAQASVRTWTWAHMQLLQKVGCPWPDISLLFLTWVWSKAKQLHYPQRGLE